MIHTLPIVRPSYIVSPSSLKSKSPERSESVPEAKQYKPPNTQIRENNQINRTILSKLKSTSYLDKDMPTEKTRETLRYKR